MSQKDVFKVVDKYNFWECLCNVLFSKCVVLNWALGWTSVAFIILYSIMEGLFFPHHVSNTVLLLFGGINHPCKLLLPLIVQKWSVATYAFFFEKCLLLALPSMLLCVLDTSQWMPWHYHILCHLPMGKENWVLLTCLCFCQLHVTELWHQIQGQSVNFFIPSIL